MSKEEKMLVLEMVAQGKITPEQGAQLLRALGDGAPEKGPASKGGSEAQVKTAPGPEISKVIQRNVEQAVQRSQEAAERAASSAEAWADEIAKRAEDAAEKVARASEGVGRTVGDSGQNLGKLIARLFAGGVFTEGPRYEFDEEVRGELPSEGEIQVRLSTTNGRITVDTWDEAGFRLSVRKTAHAPSEAEAKELVKNVYEFHQDGLTLSARSHEGTSMFGGGISVSFTLTLPQDRKASLNLDSSNGRIEVQGVKGSALKSGTANGRITVERCQFGETQLGTANGRIELEGRPGNMRASTANGRIDMKLEGAGDWKLDSANGRIEVEIEKEPGVAYEVDASTVMGRIEVTGLGDADILIDDTKSRFGSRRYKARSKGFSDSATKASLKASTTMGRVAVSL